MQVQGEQQHNDDREPLWKNPFFKHAALVVCLVVFATIVGVVYARGSRRLAATWYTDISPSVSDEIESFSAIETTSQEKERLISQLNLARLRAQHHLDITVYFYSNYYMALLVTFVSGAIAAVALFFIIKKGWQSVNSYVITIFITMSSVATMYGAFPGVFRQQENITENKTLYLRYIALENEILSYSATGRDGAGEPKLAAEFIVYLDQEFSRINNIAIGFDSTKIPIYQFEAN